MMRFSQRFVVLLLVGLLAGSLIGSQRASAQDPSDTVKQLLALKEAHAKQQAELAALRAEMLQSQAERDKLLAENAELQRAAAQAAEVRNEAATVNEAARKMIAVLQQQVAALQKQLADSSAQRDKNLQSVVEMTDQLHQAFAEVKQLKAENARLAALVPKEVAEAEADKPPATPTSEPPYLFGGQVLSVAEDGQVVISFGANDGLTPGHRLEVYRQTGHGGIYVGRVEVVQTQAGEAICKPVLQQGTIRKGDRITSKL